MIWLGSQYGKHGFEEKKIKYYHKALKLDQRDAVLYNNLGVVEYINANYQKALEYYEKAYQLFIEESCSDSLFGGTFYANYARVLEKMNQSERAYKFLLKAKRSGYDLCEDLINNDNVGVEYTRKEIMKILERNSQHLSWSNRNIIQNLNDKETVYAFKMADDTAFYVYISPSLLSITGHIKRGSGIKEGLVITDKCIYFLSKKKNKGNYYLSYISLPDSTISHSRSTLTIEVPQKSGGNATFVINTGTDAAIADKILTEIQELYRE